MQEKILYYRKNNKKLSKNYQLYRVNEFTKNDLIETIKKAGKQSAREKKKYDYKVDNVLHYTNMYQIRGGKRPLSYFNIACGFDCETTKFSDEYADIWCWQFSIENSVILGETREELESFVDNLAEWVGVDYKHRLLIFDANLNYEFNFFRTMFINKMNEENHNYFFKSTTDPVYLIINNGLEFRECLTFGGSLKKIADEYTTMAKLKGDLDYDKIRYGLSDIDEYRELDYITSDVLILSEFANLYYFPTFLANRKNPVTSTQTIRIAMKDYIKENIGQVFWIQKKIARMYPSLLLYKELMTWFIRGGYTHANYMYIDKVVRAKAMDITSAHPSQMVKRVFTQKLYKVGDLSRWSVKDILTYWRDGQPISSFYGRFTFYKIKAKTTVSVESLNKCLHITNQVIDNGRVLQADIMTVCLNHIDLKIYEMFYEWEDVKIEYLYRGSVKYLPEYYINVMLNAYQKKAELKKAHKSYAYEKTLVNGAYGCAITRMTLEDVELTEQGPVLVPKNEMETFVIESEKQLLLPQWGIEIAGWTRYQELSLIKQLIDAGHEFVYADTDSIKYIDKGNAEDIFDNYNKQSREIIKKRAEELGADFEIIKDLGEFDKEYGHTTPAYIKVLGAKRYCVVEKKTGKGWRHETTTAGLPKNEYYKLFNGTGKEIITDTIQQEFFDRYTLGLKVYNCKKTSFYSTDHDCVVLRDCDFSMMFDTNWLNFLREQHVI